MKVFLMHPASDLDLERPLPPNAADLRQDLGLGILCTAMAMGDPFVHEVADRMLLCSITDPGVIAYRQRVLRDCIDHPDTVRELYAIAVAAIEEKRKISFAFRSPELVLHSAVKSMEAFAARLRQLRRIADRRPGEWRSEGFTTFFEMLQRELDDEYLKTLDEHLRQLRFRNGVLISAELGKGGKGARHVLRTPEGLGRNWRERLGLGDRTSYVYRVPERDEAGAQALGAMRATGVNLVADALAQSADHVLGFFTMLRWELGFCVGCVNLHEQLIQRGMKTCFPEVMPAPHPGLATRGLYDVGLALRAEPPIVANDVSAADAKLIMATGANQGGKSTFLRSVGLAQLMLQCGMYAGAEQLATAVRSSLFTHFKREEDAAMESGKLDEELARMSVTVDQLQRGSLMLCNESFAATNEREGSEIARQIIGALVDAGVEVVFVTHLHHLSHGLHLEQSETTHFLRAERLADGRRTYRLIEGEPLPTSHGEDVYRRVFGSGLVRPAEHIGDDSHAQPAR